MSIEYHEKDVNRRLLTWMETHDILTKKGGRMLDFMIDNCDCCGNITEVYRDKTEWICYFCALQKADSGLEQEIKSQPDNHEYCEQCL